MYDTTEIENVMSLIHYNPVDIEINKMTIITDHMKDVLYRELVRDIAGRLVRIDVEDIIYGFI